VKPKLVADILGCSNVEVEANLPYVLQTLSEYGLLDRPTLIAAIATIGVETGGFKPIKEFGGTSYFTRLYEHRKDLGNNRPGDGALFCGRGFIQITGRSNYFEYGKILGIPLGANPDLALDPAIAAKILVLYFRNRKIPQLAAAGNWKGVRRAVNGGLNGWGEFYRFVERARKMLPEEISPVEAKALLLNEPHPKKGGRGKLQVKAGLAGITLKTSTVQSSTLPPAEKYQLAADFPLLPIAQWETVVDLKTGEHYKFSLDGITINGCNIWFASTKHAEIIPQQQAQPLMTMQVVENRQVNFEDIASGRETGIPVTELKTGVNRPLVIKTQELLINNKLLAAPADGVWGPKSDRALQNYQKLRGINETGLGVLTAKSLYQVAYKNLVEGFDLNGDWASRAIMWMKLHGFLISTGRGEINIVYFRGLDKKGVWNGNEDFVFNDRRTVLVVENGVPKFADHWLATVDPGRDYWFQPLNPKGCANIGVGQYQAWSVGMHKDQKALVQTGEFTVFRGKNKTPDKGIFGINQHTVGANDDFSVGDAVRFWSAGCLVGASAVEHYKEFMPLVCSDPREKESPGRYRHWTTVIPGDEFLAYFPA